jgi:hypothetical protein
MQTRQEPSDLKKNDTLQVIEQKSTQQGKQNNLQTGIHSNHMQSSNIIKVRRIQLNFKHR